MKNKILNFWNAITGKSKDKYIGSWEGTSKNKDNEEDRRSGEGPNDFGITFKITHHEDNVGYIGMGELKYERTEGKLESSEIQIQLSEISNHGIIVFHYQPNSKSEGFYGTGICRRANEIHYKGESVGCCVGFAAEDPGLVSANMSINKIE